MDSSEAATAKSATRKSTERATRLSVEPGIFQPEVIKHLDRIAAEENLRIINSDDASGQCSGLTCCSEDAARDDSAQGDDFKKSSIFTKDRWEELFFAEIRRLTCPQK
jgi:hypothetical protein